MALPAVYSAGSLAMRLASAAPGALSAIGARLGVAPTVKAISSYAMQNKLTFATIAYTGYTAGESAWAWLSDGGELLDAVKEMAGTVSHKADSIAPSDISDVMRYADELQLITSASRQVGGMERLLTLRKVLALPDEYFVLHRQLQGINL